MNRKSATENLTPDPWPASCNHLILSRFIYRLLTAQIHLVIIERLIELSTKTVAFIFCKEQVLIIIETLIELSTKIVFVFTVIIKYFNRKDDTVQK